MEKPTAYFITITLLVIAMLTLSFWQDARYNELQKDRDKLRNEMIACNQDMLALNPYIEIAKQGEFFTEYRIKPKKQTEPKSSSKPKEQPKYFKPGSYLDGNQHVNIGDECLLHRYDRGRVDIGINVVTVIDIKDGYIELQDQCGEQRCNIYWCKEDDVEKCWHKEK